MVNEPSVSRWSRSGVMLRPTAPGAAYSDHVVIVPAAGNSRPMVMPPPNGATPRSTSGLPTLVLFVTKNWTEKERASAIHGWLLKSWPTDNGVVGVVPEVK